MVKAHPTIVEVAAKVLRTGLVVCVLDCDGQVILYYKIGAAPGCYSWDYPVL